MSLCSTSPVVDFISSSATFTCCVTCAYEVCVCVYALCRQVCLLLLTHSRIVLLGHISHCLTLPFLSRRFFLTVSRLSMSLCVSKLWPFVLFRHVAAKNLALLGDIGNPRLSNYSEFVLLQADRFEHVFLIAGNHEYYQSTPEGTKRTMLKLASQRENIHVLFEESFQLTEKVRVVGTTLWARVDRKKRRVLQQNMSDFRQIRQDNDDEDLLTVDAMRSYHDTCVSWLRSQLEEAEAKGHYLVVLTHHAPLLDALPKRKQSTFLQSAYTTDLRDMFGGQVLAWMYGHTHHSMDVCMRGTRIVSNPRGYKREELQKKGEFDPMRVLRLEFPAAIDQLESRLRSAASNERCVLT